MAAFPTLCLGHGDCPAGQGPVQPPSPGGAVGEGGDMAAWTALARTSEESGGPLKSSCVTLNEPHNLSEYQFILNHTDVTVSAPTREQVPLRSGDTCCSPMSVLEQCTLLPVRP